jgi:beta-glucosidase/6-phospho-beta-glucosidase/beta-galactosidase
VDGKLPSIWDTATHRKPNGVADNTTGDDVANSYYFYEKDVEILRDTGVNF